MPESSKKIRKVVKISVLVLAALFFLFVISKIPNAIEGQNTEETVAYIQAQRITMADVMGDNLPPEPDPTLVDATVEGVDANGNGIRDDVELAIFELYTDDPVVRSAMLQYALGLQLELTQVFNSETWVAAVEESGRGRLCLSATGPEVSLADDEGTIVAALAVGKMRINETEMLVYNSESREQKKDEVVGYIASHGMSEKAGNCDVDPSELNQEIRA